MSLAALAVAAAFSLQTQGAAATDPKLVPCLETLTIGANPATVAVCQGDEQMALAGRHPAGSDDRRYRLTSAAAHYRRAATLTADDAVKEVALKALADLYDTAQLDDPAQLEYVLFDLAALRPGDPAYLFRIAKSQEGRGLFDAAENTLLAARQLRHDDPEPFRMLAQFYARRASELHFAATAADRQSPQAAAPATPDENGVYRIGAGVAAPQRKGVPRMSAEASAAGITGIVILEVTIDEMGTVTDARVVRSIPLLDADAIRAVREWQFEPTIVDGRAVPVKMTVTVDFTR
jgi:TonB family protein